MEAELREIFTHCVGFDGVNDEASFANYSALPDRNDDAFNDYYVDLDATVKSLPVWPVDKNLIPAGAGAVVIVGSYHLLFLCRGCRADCDAPRRGGARRRLWMAYASILAAGAKPFPRHQTRIFRPFSRASIAADLRPLRDRQADAGSGPSVGAEFHAAFGDFVAKINQIISA